MAGRAGLRGCVVLAALAVSSVAVAVPRARAQTMSQVAAAQTSCSTTGGEGLSLQLVNVQRCLHPGQFVSFANANITATSARVHLVAQASARDALQAAAAQVPLSVNSGFRPVSDQYLLWASGECAVVAAPGSSNHQSGRAVDVDNTVAARSVLTAAGCAWLGASDAVHYDCPGMDLRTDTITAFQRLWNINRPTMRLAEDGAWGPMTLAAMQASPAAGFALGGLTTCGPCTNGAAPNACGTCGAAPAELCDGLDNDCDGTTDEGCGTGDPDAGVMSDSGVPVELDGGTYGDSGVYADAGVADGGFMDDSMPNDDGGGFGGDAAVVVSPGRPTSGCSVAFTPRASSEAAGSASGTDTPGPAGLAWWLACGLVGLAARGRRRGRGQARAQTQAQAQAQAPSLALGLRVACRPLTWLASLGLLAAGCVAGGPPSAAEQHAAVVYGADDRAEVYAHPSLPLRELAHASVVALMGASRLEAQPDGSFALAPTLTLGEAYDLCRDQRFVDQPTSAFCSGTLVAPDIVLTAGHCVVTTSACLNTRVVFDYLYSADGVLAPLEASDVYTCAAVLARQDGVLDYAYLRLDRPVVGHTPATLAPGLERSCRSVLASDDVAMLGFGAGVPLKIDSGGVVLEAATRGTYFFRTALDAFGGNSGSGVFNVDNELVGVLSSGAADFVVRSGADCSEVNVLEEASGIEQVGHLLPTLVSYCAAASEPDPTLCAHAATQCGAATPDAGVTADAGPSADGGTDLGTRLDSGSVDQDMGSVLDSGLAPDQGSVRVTGGCSALALTSGGDSTARTRTLSLLAALVLIGLRRRAGVRAR